MKSETQRAILILLGLVAVAAVVYAIMIYRYVDF